MSDDLVRAESRAVRALKRGVERYGEQIRDAAGRARREVAAADRKAREAVERRRVEVHNCERSLRTAEVALRHCQENCGGLQQQVGDATRKLTEAKQLLDRARQAAQLTAAAQAELLKAAQSAEATVGQHSSVASAALASLDAKLADMPKFGASTAIHNLAVSTALGVEILGAAVDLSPTVGNALQAAGISNPVADSSITEMVDRQNGQERDYVIEQEFEARKRMASGDGREADA